ncbi:MAG: hypothetical protein OEY14_06120, partial [Myxococcales bacterium]|nr:hypothetical protein [Myxococcales bacterium]
PGGEAPDDFDDDEGATKIAAIPEELLAAAGDTASAEEAHFRDVFDKFVAMKKKCGEPTAGLTFQKLRKTLEKNREQIVKRHGAKRVTFTVYVKNGKAALKATPHKT